MSAGWLTRISPNLALALGITLALGVGVVDCLTPAFMKFAFIHLLVVGFVAWRGGWIRSLIIACISGAIISTVDWMHLPQSRAIFLVVWNTSASILTFVAIGWLITRLADLNRHLAGLVEERTRLWQAEVEKHKAAADRLAETLQLFEQVAEHMDEVIWLADPRVLRFHYVSPSYERISGRPRDPLYTNGHAWLENVHPEDLDMVTRSTSDMSRTNIDIEYRIVRPDGKVRWIRTRGLPIRKDDNEADRIAGVGEDITERRQTEQNLVEALDWNGKLIAHAPVGIAVYREDGQCILANETMAAIAGGPVEELLKTNFRQHDAWRQSGLLERATRVLETGQSLQYESRGTSSFGRFLVFICAMSRIFRQGQPHLLLMAVDITDRDRATALLRAQRELADKLSKTSNLDVAMTLLLETALELGTVDCGGVYLLEPGGALRLRVHRGLSKTFVDSVSFYPAGTDRTAFVLRGKPSYQVFAELADRREIIEEGIRSLAIIPLTHEGVIVGALNLASRKLGEFPAQIAIAIESITAMASGAIARIRAETALRESEKHLRTVVSGAPLFLFAADKEGRITFQDGQALKALGVLPGQMVGRKVEDVYRDSPLVIENMRRALAGEEFSSFVELGRVALDLWYTPTRDETGAVIGYSGVATNVTERLRLQRQLLELSDYEQARIGQDIHDGLCQQLVSLAFDANLLERQLGDANRAEVAKAKRIVLHLDQAITDARQVSRGLFPVRLETEGLAAALNDLAKSTGERFSIDCRFHSDGPAVVKDRGAATHIYRIAQEAVNNAIRHAHPHQVTIHLGTTGPEIELVIENDGAGFDPQAPQNPAGMGLEIMRYRAASIGGRLDITSIPGGGSRVCCKFVPGKGVKPLQSAPSKDHP